MTERPDPERPDPDEPAGAGDPGDHGDPDEPDDADHGDRGDPGRRPEGRPVRPVGGAPERGGEGRAGDRGTVVVVAGGDPPAPDAAAGLPAGAYVVAADSGLDHAAALGLQVDVVVGDLDSVRPESLAAAAARGVTVVRYPEAKDATDLELGLDLAAARNPSRVVVLSGAGGRADHVLASALLLAADRYAGIPSLEARIGRAAVTVVRHRATLRGEPGDLVSLLPLHGGAQGVTTDGLLYPLADEDLVAGSSRGVSNELLAPTASVRVRAGVLLAVQPGERGTHLASRSGPERPVGGS